ncbi:hypothetical protein GCM10022419_136960 [Nonomuraea rosea]|uniref:Uncharacterized protein n=1 Tax=Nonomuraea rosea TaxID=638574 RepID=A0ABP7AF32_9ACTN
MILTAAIFIICAILVYNFKFYDLIAGFNTMSDDEKATYNIEKIPNKHRAIFKRLRFLPRT